MGNTNKKIVWLSILQGWSMLLVVIGHIMLNNEFELSMPIDSAAMKIQYIIYDFHMPLFMFISGFLFWMTQISKEKSYSQTVIAKLTRLGIPFLFFTAITVFLKFIFKPLMKRHVVFSFREITDVFYITSGGNPLGEMWFIYTLFILFLFYPLYKFSLKRPLYTILFLIIAVVLNLLFPDDIYFLCCSRVAFNLLYFYSGILLSKYEFYKKLDSWIVLAVCVITFSIASIFNFPGIIIAFAGIASSFSLCLCLSHNLPNLFSSFRNYTYQIFLIGIFPQMLIRYFFLNKVFVESFQQEPILINILYILLYMTSAVLALYIPTITSKIVEKIPLKGIRMLIGLS